jgi:hypothetical protein
MAAASQQEAIANWNAQRLEEQDRRARAVGFLEAEQERKKGEQVMARQRAIFAEGGADTTYGTPLLVQQETAAEAELNARIKQTNREAEGKRYADEAGATRAEGALKASASRMQGAASLLSGFSQFAGGFSRGGGGGGLNFG